MQSRIDPLPALRAAAWLIGMYALFVVVIATMGGVAGSPEPWERELIRDIAAARTETAGRVTVAITHLGDALTVTLALAGLTVGSAVGRARGWAPFFSATLLGAIGIHPVAKVLVERVRPETGSFIDVGGYAFPSGHATASAALATALIVFLLGRIRGTPRTVVVIGAVVYAGAVGLSRVLLGVHWPTDVVAGWLVGVSWVLVIARMPARTRNA